MVIYDLVCEQNHQFEGWFKSSEDWQQQLSAGLLTCPYCDSQEITKKPTASKVTKKTNTGLSKEDRLERVQQVVHSHPQSPEKFAQLQSMLRKVHDYIDQNFEDVGNQFAEQAISMHKGDREEANIRGVATKEEVAELAEAGVEAIPLPPKPIDPEKLN